MCAKELRAVFYMYTVLLPLSLSYSPYKHFIQPVGATSISGLQSRSVYIGTVFTMLHNLVAAKVECVPAACLNTDAYDT